MLAFSVWVAYLIRLQVPFVPNPVQTFMIVLAPVVAIPVFIRTGLYRAVLRYLSDRALWTIIKSVTLAVLLWVAVAFVTSVGGIEGIPRSVPFIYWAFAVPLIVVSRFGARWLLTGAVRKDFRRRTLIFGTGEAGTQLASALLTDPERLLIGFISEDRGLIGMDLLGLRVYPANTISHLVEDMGANEIIVATQNPTAAQKNVILSTLVGHPVKLRVLPPIGEIASGKYIVNHIRDIEIEDLLGRAMVQPHAELLHNAVSGKCILITGAAGSIGTALAQAISEQGPSRLILLDTNEHGLFQLGRALEHGGGSAVELVLGSIADKELMSRVLSKHEVQGVYHCAAYKHVHLTERNVLEAVRNNVLGTEALLGAVRGSQVENFVLISSDKAVRPAGVMGATKRWAELLVRHQSEAASGRCVYSTVRFGNVLGSSGSVVPIFREQIAGGGPVTLTDENMTRYFMTLREAAELILQSSSLASDGDIFVLEMGQPMRIRELAESMIMLAGMTVRSEANPMGDIDIVTIGAREGEKIHEELFYDPSSVTKTENPRILQARRSGDAFDAVPDMLASIRAALDAADEAATREILFRYATAGN